MDVRRVTVAGTGMMRLGIAATFALAGRQVTIVSRTAEGAACEVATAKSLIQQLARNDLSEPEQAREAGERLSPSTDLETAVRDVQLVLETIPESLTLKQEFFARVDRASPEAILCSNTSGISITAIAEKAQAVRARRDAFLIRFLRWEKERRASR